MLRPMFVEFPEDPSVWHLDTQYMLGPNVLVVPVFNAEGVVRYYLPEGEWYGILDHKTRKGPGFVTETHSFMSVPILLRPESAIATSDGKRESPVYDYAKDVVVLANLKNKNTKVMIDIPNSQKPGSIAARLEVTTSSVTVVDGQTQGERTLKLV